MKITLTLLTLGLLNAAGMAADQPLGKPFGIAAGSVVKTCEQKQIGTLLVRVLPDGRGLNQEEIGRMLETIEKELQAVLKAANRDGKILARGAEEFATGVLTPEEARQLLQAEQGNALLTADYLEKKSASSLRLAFFTEGGLQWVKRIRVEPVREDQPQIAAAQQFGNPNFQNPLNNNMHAFTQPNMLPNLATAQNLAVNGLATGNVAGSLQGVGSATAQSGENFEEESAGSDDLDARILQFALDHLGEKVGNGECWTLANEALIAAGAQPARGYTFGREIGVEDIEPGNILQFKQARFDYNNAFAILGAPNHTAIVKEADENSVTILHQNFGGKTVTELTINFQNMTAGQVWAYEAIPAGTAAQNPTQCRNPNRTEEPNDEEEGTKTQGLSKPETPSTPQTSPEE